jgi:hypothetical protein
MLPLTVHAATLRVGMTGRGDSLLVCLRLDLVQLGVPAAASHQVVMGADFGDSRAVHHDDEVGHPDRTEPV